MAYVMTGNNYAPQERKIFEILTRGGRMSTSDVTNKVYGRKGRPFYDRQAVLGALKSLAAKADINGESFKICRSERCGPAPIEFWIERR